MADGSLPCWAWSPSTSTGYTRTCRTGSTLRSCDVRRRFSATHMAGAIGSRVVRFRSRRRSHRLLSGSSRTTSPALLILKAQTRRIPRSICMPFGIPRLLLRPTCGSSTPCRLLTTRIFWSLNTQGTDIAALLALLVCRDDRPRARLHDLAAAHAVYDRESAETLRHRRFSLLCWTYVLLRYAAQLCELLAWRGGTISTMRPCCF